MVLSDELTYGMIKFMKSLLISFDNNKLSSNLFVTSVTSFHWTRTMAQSESSICTHDGVFHCDDVVACYLLKQLPEFKDFKIIRTRDQKIIDSSDVVVDVGGIYDHDKRRYDHHQREFTHTLNSLDSRKPFKIKLSSAGLVYHHYGRKIISQFLGINQSEDDVEILFDKLYESFMQEVDAIDNGVEICEGNPRYTINSGVSSRVSYLIPPWNEEASEETLYDRFLEAIKMVGVEFEDRLKYYGKAWYPAKVYVQEAVQNRFSVHPSGAIMDLSAYSGVPWKEHLFTIEKDLGIEGKVKFAVFTSIDDKWRVIAVPLQPKSFSCRLPLHPNWRGLRDDKLSEVSGIPGCIFVHASGFIGGGLSKETCISLADKTMAAADKSEKDK